jgi:hypothetical protein
MLNKLTKKFYDKNSYIKRMKIFFSKKELKSYQKYFLIEREAYFNYFDISKTKNLLDVGTGRQSLALSKYFKNIHHFDISNAHHKYLKKIISKKKINITSKRADIENCNLKKNFYDFINLDGVVMHTNSPSKMLTNVFKSLKSEGLMKILIYKRGSLKFIIIEFLRELVKKNKLKIESPYKNKIANWLVDDDLYVPYIRFYDDKELLNFLCKLNNNNKKNIKKKNVNLIKTIDTKNFHHSETFFVKKSSKLNKKIEKFTINHKTQLDKNFLKKDKFFYKECGNLMLQILKQKTKNNLFLKMSVINIYKICLKNIFFPNFNYIKIIRLLKSELETLKLNNSCH